MIGQDTREILKATVPLQAAGPQQPRPSLDHRHVWHAKPARTSLCRSAAISVSRESSRIPAAGSRSVTWWCSTRTNAWLPTWSCYRPFPTMRPSKAAQDLWHPHLQTRARSSCSATTKTSETSGKVDRGRRGQGRMVPLRQDAERIPLLQRAPMAAASSAPTSSTERLIEAARCRRAHAAHATDDLAMLGNRAVVFADRHQRHSFFSAT